MENNDSATSIWTPNWITNVQVVEDFLRLQNLFQAFQSNVHNRSKVHRHAPYLSRMLNLLRAQNLKPHDDESKDSDDDDEFDTFAEEQQSNWNDLIADG